MALLSFIFTNDAGGQLGLDLCIRIIAVEPWERSGVREFLETRLLETSRSDRNLREGRILICLRDCIEIDTVGVGIIRPCQRRLKLAAFFLRRSTLSPRLSRSFSSPSILLIKGRNKGKARRIGCFFM
jgi:hypothetical protein